jgi:hypothetical protein
MKIHMIRVLLTSFILAATQSEAGTDASNPYEGAQVANFAVTGRTEDSPEFERLSFWSGPNGEVVDYVLGSDGEPLRLKPMGVNADRKSFAIRLPNTLMLDIEPRGDSLLVRDRWGRYRQEFAWQYEGPVEGRGTFCEACVDEDAAIDFVREHFMR